MNQSITGEMEEVAGFDREFVQLARMALSEQTEDVRLYLASLVRQYRRNRLPLSRELEKLLKSSPARSGSVLRRAGRLEVAETLPLDSESQMSLLKVYRDEAFSTPPVLSPNVRAHLDQLIDERAQSARLAAAGLSPTRSAIFVGQPGVGKTLSARWLASRLGQPLYVLDLTTVMSSLLGKTGSNLRAALDFAKRNRSVLLLDEIDAVAKRRGDESDVGEIKRLVTVMLQEVENWPRDGLLLAATNHPELIDPALWRRFDQIVQFGLPDDRALRDAIERFLGPAKSAFSRWLDVLVPLFRGESFSDTERAIQGLRRRVLLGDGNVDNAIAELVATRALDHLDHDARLNLALVLSKHARWSQHRIHAVTGLARDTIRKHLKVKGAA